MIDNLELIAVILGLIYLILLIKEKIACWIFGILSSAISIYLFYSIQLYSEAILYFYYVIIGIYGSRERKIRASYFFFLYTLIGSVLILLGI